jgi:hypothetical protein
MSRVTLSLELRFLRIPTEWIVATRQVFEPGPVGVKVYPTEERAAVPAVDQSIDARPVEFDGWEWRRQFLQMKHDEASALRVLRQVGVWKAVSDHTVSKAKTGKRLLSGAFGSRYFNGWAMPVRFEEDLWRLQKYWLDLLRNPAELKKQFGPPPSSESSPFDRVRYALDTKFLNELPFHIEWRKGLPVALIECITGWEALVAITHFEMLQRAKYRNCRKCGIPYAVTTEHKKKYCGPPCAHAVASRNYRKTEKKKQKEALKNGDL